VLFQNDETFQLLVDAGLELIHNEGQGICFAACGQQALVAHCARMGKRVPAALPQNNRQMRTQILDYVVLHRDLYSLDSVWQVGDRRSGKDFDEFIAHYRQPHVFMSTSMLPVFADLMRMWTADPSLGIQSPAPRVLHYVPGRPVSHFQEVLPMDVSATLKTIGERNSNSRLHVTKFEDFECYGGVVVYQNLVESDIIFVNVFLNMHWQLALSILMVLRLESEFSVHPTLGVGAVSERPQTRAARLERDGYGAGSVLAYDISTKQIAERPAVSKPAPRSTRNVLPEHDGVGCSVLTAYTARTAMHMNVPHMLSASWTSGKTKRVWEAVLRAFKRDTRTWCLGKSGLERSAGVHDVLTRTSVASNEATRLEIGVNTNKHDVKSMAQGHPLRTVMDGQSSADDISDLAEITSALDKCQVDQSIDPEMLVFAIGPHKGSSWARTHNDSYHNFAFQVPEYYVLYCAVDVFAMYGH